MSQAHIFRLFSTVLAIASATGRQVPAQWTDIAGHLPPIAVTHTSTGVCAHPAVPGRGKKRRKKTGKQTGKKAGKKQEKTGKRHVVIASLKGREEKTDES
jgi:hypothetical protein